jgi:hypothetical protein
MPGSLEYFFVQLHMGHSPGSSPQEAVLDATVKDGRKSRYIGSPLQRANSGLRGESIPYRTRIVGSGRPSA